MAQYRLTTETFLAPWRLKPGAIVNWNGPPGPHMIPLDDDAHRAMEAYVKNNPHATMRPVDQLPVQNTVEVLEIGTPKTIDLRSALTESLAARGEAKPGLSSGGVLPPNFGGDPAAVVTIDSKESGSNGKTVDGVIADDVVLGGGFQTHGQKASLGDPAKPGESKMDGPNEAKTAQANAAAEAVVKDKK